MQNSIYQFAKDDTVCSTLSSLVASLRSFSICISSSITDHSNTERLACEPPDVLYTNNSNGSLLLQQPLEHVVHAIQESRAISDHLVGW